MDIVAHVRRLPRELQYAIRRYVGWHRASREELLRIARQRRAPWIVERFWPPRRELSRYSIPKWCPRCGEGKQRLIKCPRCLNSNYHLIYWSEFGEHARTP